MKRVLLVEPDRIQAAVYQTVLGRAFDVRWVRTTQGAISAMDKRPFDVVVSETTLDHHNGVELLNELRGYEDWKDVPIIFLSALPKERFPLPRKSWKDFGVKAFLNKASTRPSTLKQAVVEAAHGS